MISPVVVSASLSRYAFESLDRSISLLQKQHNSARFDRTVLVILSGCSKLKHFEPSRGSSC